MKLSYNYPICIDQNIRKVDKDFFLCLEQALTNSNFKLLDIDKANQGEDVLSIVFNNSYSESELERYVGQNKILINCLKHNLNLFEPAEDSINIFELNSSSEIDGVIKMIEDLLSSELILYFSVVKAKSDKKVKQIEASFDVSKSLFDIDGFDNSISLLSGKSELVEEVNKIFSENKISAKLCYLSDLKGESRESVFLGEFNQNLIFIVFDDNFDEPIIIFSLMNFLKEQDNMYKDLIKAEELKNFFLMIKTPIVILNQQNHVLASNSAFSKLNLSISSFDQLKNGEQREINNELYRVASRRVEWMKVLILFKVKSVNSSLLKANNKELGIVTSSIAHELNNPLGGILAALDVLLLDELENDFLVKIIEMKKTVKRCKNLVETFLGFSRVNVHHSNATMLSLEECSSQAIDLVRFRLIESNISLKYEYELKENFGISSQPSISVIMLYLIFGEIVTEYSHSKLIHKTHKDFVQIHISEKSKVIEIVTNEEVSLKSSFVKSKLFSHLLDEHQLTIKLKANKITLSL